MFPYVMCVSHMSLANYPFFHPKTSNPLPHVTLISFLISFLHHVFYHLCAMSPRIHLQNFVSKGSPTTNHRFPHGQWYTIVVFTAGGTSLLTFKQAWSPLYHRYSSTNRSNGVAFSYLINLLNPLYATITYYPSCTTSSLEPHKPTNYVQGPPIVFQHMVGTKLMNGYYLDLCDQGC